MDIKELIETIRLDNDCIIKPPKTAISLPDNLPDDLKIFFELTDGVTLFGEEAYGIEIVSRQDLIPTNKYLYPKDDVIWEELEGEVSNEWYLIAKADEISQYISIDLTDERKGQCYDSFYETHSLEGDSPVIARNFTELLTRLYQHKGEHWYWLQGDFEQLGDAYDEPVI